MGGGGVRERRKYQRRKNKNPFFCWAVFRVVWESKQKEKSKKVLANLSKFKTERKRKRFSGICGVWLGMVSTGPWNIRARKTKIRERMEPEARTRDLDGFVPVAESRKYQVVLMKKKADLDGGVIRNKLAQKKNFF